MDGAGSNLDADLLDGLSSTSFLRAGANTSQGAGYYIATDEVRAVDSDGLLLRDDSGTTGIFIEDGGDVGIGTTSITSGVKLEVNGGIYARSFVSCDSFIDLKEIAEPSAPPTGTVRIYRDSTGGSLKAKFSDGSVVTIAAKP